MPDLPIAQHQMPAVEFNELGTIHPTGKYTLGTSVAWFSVVYTIDTLNIDLTYYGDQESFICLQINEAAKIIAAYNDSGDEEE
jgi:hypothetical protein